MRRFLLLLGVLCLFAGPAKAQFIGYTSPQTVSFNKTNLACGSSTTVPNIGQSIHSVNYTASLIAANSSMVSIVGSNDGTNFFNIGHEAWGLQGQVLGFGYAALVKINLDCYTNGGAAVTGAGAGTFNFQYSGTSVAPPGPVSASLESTIRKLICNNCASGTTQTQSIGTPYGSTSGTILFVYSGTGPASSTLAVKVADASTITTTVQTFNLATSTAVQKFQVNHFPVAANIGTAAGIGSQSPVNITYTAGGASATTFQLLYFFDPPGYTLSSFGTAATQVQGTAASGSAISGNPVLVAGSDGTNVRTVEVQQDSTAFNNTTPNVALVGGIGGLSGSANGNARAITACDQSTFVDITTATTTQLVLFSGSLKVRVCSFAISNGGTAQTIRFQYGTGAACATGLTNVSPLFSMAPNQSVTAGNGLGELFQTATGKSLCVVNSSATQIGVLISFAQY